MIEFPAYRAFGPIHLSLAATSAPVPSAKLNDAAPGAGADRSAHSENLTWMVVPPRPSAALPTSDSNTPSVPSANPNPAPALPNTSPADKPKYTLRTDKGMSVETSFADSEAAEIIEKSTSTDDFARSLARDFRRFGALTPNKQAWMHKKAIEIATPPAAPAPGSTFMNIINMFKSATASDLKRPSLKFSRSGGPRGLKISLNTRGGYPGSVTVATAHSDVYLGRIGTDGVFTPCHAYAGTDLAIEALDFLRRLDADPAGQVAAAGLLSGECCMCSRELTDPQSVKQGFGPVCAKRFGLKA